MSSAASTSTSLLRTQAFILAGGQGERLAPLTLSRPKPAVSFGGGFRVIDFTLSNCLHSAVEHVSVLTQYRHEALHSYLREGWIELWNESFGSASRLVCLPPVSGKQYRGTADAVLQNIEVMQSHGSDHVLVLSGDHVYQMDYRDLLRQHVETGADMTIAAVEQPLEQASRFGVLQVNDRSQVASFSEKPENPSPIPSRPEMALTSMGVYVFKRSALAELARWPKELLLAHDFGRDVIPLLISSGKVYVYNFRDEERDVPRYWRDIGTIDSYYEASMDLTGQDPIFDPYANYHRPSQPTRRPAASESVQRAHRPRVALDSRVRRSVLSPDVEIAGGVYIERSILLPGVRIGEGAHLRRVIVEEGVEIPAGVRIGFDLDKDRERHAVTGSGVVVVNKREPSNRIGPHAPPAPIGRRSGLRQVHWINV